MSTKNLRTISSLNLKGKTIFLRVDLNSEIKNKKPLLSPRIRAHAKTITQLKKKKARIIVIAHQSRPKKKDFTSLKLHAALLNKFTKIKFINDIIGKKAQTAIENLENGEAILLENIRYLKDEYNTKITNNKIVNFFKDKIDVYINDAFSISHRSQCSLTSIPKIIKTKAAGPVFKKELDNAEKIRKNIHNSLFILGGNKVEDIQLLLNKKNILPTGVLALLVLKAKGYNLGKKQEQVIKPQLKFIPKIKRNIKNIHLPKDLAYEVNKKRVEVKASNLPKYNNNLALDIGSETIKSYIETIKKSYKIFWKGTAGDTSIKEFEKGTKDLLKAIEKSNSFAVVAGGHSQTAIEKFKINPKNIGYLSLSGGALVHYISNKKLPGLEALK